MDGMAQHNRCVNPLKAVPPYICLRVSGARVDWLNIIESILKQNELDRGGLS